MIPGSGIPTTVEVILLSQRDGRLRYRTVRAGLRSGAFPDDVALGLSGLKLCTPGGLLHSTSWRHTADTLVLTYAALPDPRPDLASADVSVDGMRSGLGPLVPSPPSIDADAVAAHACRHLALLRTTDDLAADAARSQPELWTLIAKLMPGTAGSPHPPHLVC
ncbi:MAG: hypothetical protein HOU81_09635 [Hamadaea sp.]|uniref:hypothetical protein n=1 Tax=Hamadaea sp. TaxID=2024425 RepID=UPI00180EFAD1|nr:hypothetical protein [Hamadaea sp.]NUR71071.1 hypothetical protein [Hamadaea sp.]NUT23984.1 hypothetical protein [Hamadaea sp.]